MITSGGKVRDRVKSARPTSGKEAAPFSAAGSMTGRASNGSESFSEEHNPLINDLLKDLENSSSEEVHSTGHLHEQSINGNALANFDPQLRRPSDELMASCLSSHRNREKAVADILCTTGQHFVHVMWKHKLEAFFCPGRGEKAEDVLRRELRKKNQEEVEAVVLSLAELLEDVRKARGQLAPLAGPLGGPDTARRRSTSFSSIHSAVSTASLMRPPVHETNQLAVAYDQQGNRMINFYRVIANLGRGAYGKVKLGVDTKTGQTVAIKIIDKKLLKRIGGLGSSNQGAALKREIAIMKKVRHRNCVSLYEVIDDPDSNVLYLIMEYVPNGPVVRLKPQEFSNIALRSIEDGLPLNGEVCNKALMRCAVRQSATGDAEPLTEAEINSNPTIFLCKPLSQHICALYLRQLVSGLRYMHKRNLVHHDIKPDNILVGTNHQVFLSDFGVSEILSTRQEVKNAVKNHDRTSDASNACSFKSDASDSTNEDGPDSKPRLGGGTLLFTAPELFDNSVNKRLLDPHLTDVWALGVTLYCMLVGMSPFFGNTYAEVRTNILTQAYPWCGKTVYGTPLAEEWRVVLNGLLEKKPKDRWSLVRLKSFLDQSSFQQAMQQSALFEASMRTRSLPSIDADASLLTSTAQHSALLRASLQTTTSAKELQPPLTDSSAAEDTSVSLPLPRLVSSEAVSAVSKEVSSTVNDFLLDFRVSEKEVRDATRTMKVEVMRQTTVLSAHTRTIVHRFVEWIRVCTQARNSIPLNCAPPLTTISHADAPLPAQMCAGTKNRSTTFTCSGENVHVTHVPVLTVEKTPDRNSEVGPIHTKFLSPHRSLHSPKAEVRQRIQENGGGSGSSVGSHPVTGGSLENRGSSGRLRSLDAALSIVNLQSACSEPSVTFSSMSSSPSSQASLFLKQMHSGDVSGKETGSNNGIVRANVEITTVDTLASKKTTNDKVSWCNVHTSSPVAKMKLVNSATRSAIGEGVSRKRSGTNGIEGRFQQSVCRKKTLSGTSVSDGLTSCPSTTAPKSCSTATPLLNSVLSSGTSGFEDSNLAGYCCTLPNKKTASVADGCLPVPSEEPASAAQLPGLKDKRSSAISMQRRVGDGKPAVRALTSFEQVPHVTASKRLPSVARK